MPAESFGDWQVVSRKANHKFLHLLAIALQTLARMEPATYSSMTWTVRHRITGETRDVTAMSEEEAAKTLAAIEAHRATDPAG